MQVLTLDTFPGDTSQMSRIRIHQHDGWVDVRVHKDGKVLISVFDGDYRRRPLEIWLPFLEAHPEEKEQVWAENFKAMKQMRSDG